MTDHEDLDQAPYDDRETARQVAAVLDALPTSPARVLDLGCGAGRIGGPVAEAGHEVHGIDHDAAHASDYAEAVGPRGRFQVGDLLGPWPLEGGPYDAVLLLGNVVMTVREPADLRRLFASVAGVLAKDGVILVDDFPEGGWEELSSGRWADGIDESGSMQMVWSTGNPEFAVRMGSRVDPERTTPDPDERILRLWSRRELDDAAGFANIGPAAHVPEGLVTLHRRLRSGSGRNPDGSARD